MTFHISYRPEAGIVRILFHGTVGLAERMEALELVAEKFQHRTPLRVLVDLRYTRSEMVPEEQRRLGRFLAEHPVLGRAHIAVLYWRDRYTSLMVASEAKARGHSSREFDIEAEAEAWLLQARDETPSLASLMSVNA
ncbi:hypothetical protein [Microbulbifer marinus]|uniref:SpoIIAA-like n=1 Tax=Microbulbifer marinus TaxID=658218 RepID=A0A1H4AKT0_9GAMM|nr:hypothetical protein [Microbulbifer marinus]SEA36520.1 hypothetical protein SAMN05216562_2851 [Microbulbifer marinus]